jgi:hypothetical protein
MRKLALITVLGLGCSDTRDTDVVGTQSLALTLISPTDTGTIDRRLPDTERTIVFDIEAKDAEGDRDTSFSAELSVYAQFLGTLTPEFGTTPLATFQLVDGIATAQSVTLPNVFGPTVVWIDNGTGFGPAYVHGNLAGTSPTLWYRDPFISDLQTPRDEMGLDALNTTPLQDKQVTIGGSPDTESAKLASRYGARGRLVINSVFAQGYTVSDVQCADDQGTPPCTSGAYDHAMVFTFSAPRSQNGRSLEQGDELSGFAGGLTEFLGLTEIGFPQTFAPLDVNDLDGNGDIDEPLPPRLDRLPPPAVVEASWFLGLDDPNGMINFERNEAAPIQVNNATVCDLDEEFVEFKQWKLDPAGVGGNCAGKDDVISVVTTGVSGIDPAALVGKTLPRVVGVLRPLNFGGSGNIWLIFPRSTDDLTLP